MTSTLARRAALTCLVLLAAVLAGATLSYLKGDGNARYQMALGNISAPWLIAPVVLGVVWSGRRIAASALGSAAAVFMLAGFYAASTWQGLMGPHIASAVRFYAMAGLVAGAAVGWVMSWRRLARFAPLAAAALLSLEPLAWLATRVTGPLPSGLALPADRHQGDWMLVLSIEGVIGVTLLALAVAHLRVRARWRSGRP